MGGNYVTNNVIGTIIKHLVKKERSFPVYSRSHLQFLAIYYLALFPPKEHQISLSEEHFCYFHCS